MLRAGAGVRPGCGPYWRRQRRSSLPSLPVRCSSTTTTAGQRSLEPIALGRFDSHRPRRQAATADGTVVDAGAGYAVSLEVAGLPVAPEGAYYEGWLHNESSGDWVSIGTFHMRNGDGRVVLWSGVPIADYRELVVTAETEGSGAAPGDAVLTGQLTRT